MNLRESEFYVKRIHLLFKILWKTCVNGVLLFDTKPLCKILLFQNLR